MRAIILLTLILVGGLSMAIWDTDKSNNNRLQPEINAKDNVQSRMAHGTTGFTLKGEDSDGTLGKLVFKDGKLSLIKEDGAVVNIAGDGMKVAQPGYDANTTDDANLVMTSQLNSFKIVGTGTIPITILAFDTFEQATVTHDLGYVPLVVAFSDNGIGSYTQLPLTDLQNSGASSGLVRRLITILTTSTQITITAYTPPFAANSLQGVDATYNIKYYLLRETAGE